MEIKLTREETKDELLKCGRDPIYFITNYVKINHPGKGVIPFKLYDFQKDCIKDFMNNRFNVVVKSRQLGLSTTIAAYCAWYMLFFRSKEILVVATKFSVAANLVKKTKKMIKKIPSWVKIANITIDNETSFELDNESKIKASTTSEDAGRSEALSLLVVDEAAHIRDLDTMWTAIKPTLAVAGRCILNSSPKGTGNLFHKIYSEAEQELNDFNPINLPWHVHPDRDENWFRSETKNMSTKAISQEYNCSFLGSGETVFDPKNLEEISQIVTDPIHRTGFDRNLWIFEEFENGYVYYIVADVARGDGADFSAFHIFRIEGQRIFLTGEYQGKIPTDLFANLLNEVGKKYNNCLVVVENNTIGYSVIKDLISLEYPNLYWCTKTTMEHIEQYQAEHRSDCVPGFSMTSKSRPLIIAKMEEYIRNDLITIYSKRILNEMRTFVWNSGRAESMRGYNDDLVMSCAIGCWIHDTSLDIPMKNLEYKKAFLNGIKKKTKTIDQVSLPTFRQELSEKYREQINIMKIFPGIMKG